MATDAEKLKEALRIRREQAERALAKSRQAVIDAEAEIAARRAAERAKKNG